MPTKKYFWKKAKILCIMVQIVINSQKSCLFDVKQIVSPVTKLTTY